MSQPLRGPGADRIGEGLGAPAVTPLAGPKAQATLIRSLRSAVALDAINNDIKPTPDLGPWMIYVHSYVTKDMRWLGLRNGRRAARQVSPAGLCFTHGVEDRDPCVNKAIYEQRDWLLEQRFTPCAKPKSATDTIVSDDLPLEYISSLLRVTVYQKVQCAVVVARLCR